MKMKYENSLFYVHFTIIKQLKSALTITTEEYEILYGQNRCLTLACVISHA